MCSSLGSSSSSLITYQLLYDFLFLFLFASVLDYIFTTAHKAKGLEFPAVRLGIDFVSCPTSAQQLTNGSILGLISPSKFVPTFKDNI